MDASTLDVSLRSPGVCYPCLGMVADELERADGDRSTERWVVSTLWAEGLGAPVRTAVERAVADRVAGASAALADLEARGCRSDVFRRVVRRPARELLEVMGRAEAAAYN